MIRSGTYGKLGALCGALSLLAAAVAPSAMAPEHSGAVALAILGAGFFVGAAVLKAAERG